ncbi:HBL/NHE enterotoxin family protein [Bacillus thuringiensis]|nr:HBL/NHE enterotoxin family protein [Bacillus thuringiensis]
MFYIKRKFIFLCLILPILAQFFIPNYAYADSQSLTNKLDSTATTVLENYKYFSGSINKLTAIDLQLKTSLTIHGEKTKENANYWLHTLAPGTQMIVKDIIGYNSTFQSIYNNTIDKFSSENKQEVTNSLNTLQNHLSQKQILVTEGIDKLRKYREERLSPTVRDLNSDINQILVKQNGNFAVIASLNKSISALNDKYETAKKNYQNQIKIASLNPTLAQLAAMYAMEMRNAQQEIDREKDQLKLFQEAVPILNEIKDQSNSFVGNISESIDKLQSYITLWDTLNAKIKNLISDVDSTNEIDESYFIAEMEVIQESWDSIINLTETQLSKNTQ